MGPAEQVKAVDTNVLARFVLADDPVQSPIAEQIVERGVSVSLTVLLELGWLLGSPARMKRLEVNDVMHQLLDNEAIHVEDELLVRIALELHAKGADFADAIHLVAARGSEAFVTFDRNVPDAREIGVEVERVG
jgi:predicted nucleic-acid-binding protein